MDCFKIENLSFSYPDCEKPALDNINITINEGEFLLICGKSGCGKSTLLRHLKPVVTPHGTSKGTIHFFGSLLKEVSSRELASRIGFVCQNPDNQIVTDKVWHEMAFGLESLGEKKESIRLRVAEMSAFFGVTEWFDKDVNTLSGGQKQLLNLASIMVCQPDVLILDEPTSQLDPIAASDFFNTLRKINNELGTTIILCEHRLEEVLPLADRVLAMQDGKVLVCDSPKTAGKYLSQINSELFLAMPSPMRIAQAVGTQNELPVNVREGRKFLNDYVHDKHKEVTLYEHDKNTTCTNPTKYEDIISFKDVWFRYEKNGKDIVRDLSISIKKGTIHAVVGANGAGKTTLIKLISRQVAAYRGKILINNVNLKNVSDKELFHNNLAVLPQNPTVLFSCKTAHLDLLDMLSDTNLTLEQKEEKVRKTASQVGLEPVLERHPFDLSGGEQQRLGLAKILLCDPKIILLDEPSKGLDQCFKEEFAQILYSLQERGITIVIVSHDIEFLAKHSDFCSMFFNGSITTTQKSKVFFAKNSFYTTAANRIARKVFPNAVTDEEVIFECKSLLTKEKS